MAIAMLMVLFALDSIKVGAKFMVASGMHLASHDDLPLWNFSLR